MRILYLSCHSILEYDEVKLLHELGHEVFSPGAYFDPQKAADNMRPGINGLEYDPDLVEQWHRLCGKHPGLDGKEYLSKEFVDNFDCVIVMHVPKWITGYNRLALQGKRVIWRTIGQSIHSTESSIAHMRNQIQVVRYSPMEKNIPGYIGEDQIIRFYKDPNEYGPWNGNKKQVVTFAQDMKNRGSACNFDFFESTTRVFPRHLFGPNNEKTGSWCTGRVSFERLQQEMKNNRVYFYTGTQPASYTLNFMEALMTGIPMVCIGPEHGNSKVFGDYQLYEIPDIIRNGINGFISDNTDELKSNIAQLLVDDKLAQSISQAGRETAIKLFGKETIKQQWKEFLDGK